MSPVYLPQLKPNGGNMVEGCAVKDVWIRELSAYSSWCGAGLNWLITGPVINDT